MAAVPVVISLVSSACGGGSAPPLAPELDLRPPGIACQGAIDRRAATPLAAATQSRWEGSTATFAEVEAFFDVELAGKGWAKQGHDNARTGELTIVRWARDNDLLFVTELDPSVPARECGGFLTTFVVKIGFG